MSEKLFKNIKDKLESRKRLTKSELAYQINSVGGWETLPYTMLLDFKRDELVQMFNKKFDTSIN